MKAPDALPADTFRPVYTPGAPFLFGSGNAGAGGRVLVASDGRVLLESAHGADLRFVIGRILMKAEECYLTADRADTFVLEDTTLKSVTAGAWESANPSDGTITCEQSALYDANGTQKSTVGKPSLPTEKVLALWNALKARQAPTLPTADLRPEKVTAALQTDWSDFGYVPYANTTALTEELASLSLRYTDLRPSTAGGLEQLLAEQSSVRRRLIPGILLGHYGRRDASPRLLLKGTLVRGTASTGATVSATLRLYRADTAPEDFLTSTDTPAVPAWEPLLEQTLLVTGTTPFSIPVQLQGATVHLLTLEANLRDADATVTESVPKIPSTYTPGFDNWTDEDGNLVGNWRALNRIENTAAVTLKELTIEPVIP